MCILGNATGRDQVGATQKRPQAERQPPLGILQSVGKIVLKELPLVSQSIQVNKSWLDIQHVPGTGEVTSDSVD